MLSPAPGRPLPRPADDTGTSKIRFGPWTANEVRERSSDPDKPIECIGWAGNCHEHIDCDKCWLKGAKTCSITESVSYDEARRRVKAWLIVGGAYKRDDRSTHMRHPLSLARRLGDLLPGVSEVDLDGQAVAIGERPAAVCWRCANPENCPRKSP